MRKIIISIAAIIVLSCAIYAGMIYFADQKTPKEDDYTPKAMQMIDDYYGGPIDWTNYKKSKH